MNSSQNQTSNENKTEKTHKSLETVGKVESSSDFVSDEENDHTSKNKESDPPNTFVITESDIDKRMLEKLTSSKWMKYQKSLQI